MCSSPRRPLVCRCFTTDPALEIGKLLASLEQFPQRSHLIAPMRWAKAQRVISLIRQGGYDKPIYIHGALAKLCDYYSSQGIELGELRPATSKTARKPV